MNKSISEDYELSTKNERAALLKELKSAVRVLNKLGSPARLKWYRGNKLMTPYVTYVEAIHD